METPLVTVIMPVRNNEDFLVEAIESVLKQTYRNLELIIISAFDSNEASLAIIEGFNDSRIIHIKRDALNTYIPAARNIGLEHARGVYIAYMDSDDISLPHRLETEVKFMEKHLDIAVAGSYAKSFGKKTGIIMRNPTYHDDLKVNMLFHASMVNPTAIVRAKTIKQHDLRYDENLKYCEDLDFWVRAITKVRFATIPKVLLLYRTHDKQATHQEKEFQANLRDGIFQKQLDVFGISPNDPKRILYRAIRTCSANEATPEFLSEAERWFKNIAKINQYNQIYDPKALEHGFGSEWLALCRLSVPKLRADAWKIFWHSEIRHWLKMKPRNLGRLAKLYFSV